MEHLLQQRALTWINTKAGDLRHVPKRALPGRQIRGADPSTRKHASRVIFLTRGADILRLLLAAG
jgi:hypothetical protein